VLEIDLPAVISADLRLNEPRYVKLPDIMKAKKKIIETIKLSDLNITQSPQIKNLKFEPPEERASGIKVDDVAGLVSILKERGLV
ncbi:MAG: EtfB protein, partial [Gammaproteobacteria bacterium]|nr:EtfB protein [Gammaproteobacteria bacterium]